MLTLCTEIGDPLTTVGTATHPPDASIPTTETPPSDTEESTKSTFLAPSSTPAATAQPSSSTPTTSELPIRQGTSELRQEQQNHTHAAGQLSEGTPDAAVNDHGHGDKTVTMEPNTVGQAPKEKPLPEPEQPPAPSYVDQAKNVAAQASATVTSTLGGLVGAVTGSGKKEEVKPEEPVREKSPEEKLLDERIDGSKDANVEAFLRAQNRH